MLADQWEQCGRDYEQFVLGLAGRAGLPDRPDRPAESPPGFDRPGAASPGPVRLLLGDPGTDLSTRRPVTWLLNGGGSPHVALMGGTGSGKTRLAVNLVRQVREQAGTPVILFDMAKGDLARDRDLLNLTGATVVNPPKLPVPLDVLHLPDASDIEVSNAAVRFRDSFARIPNQKVGAVQRDALREAARNAFTNRQPPLDIATIRDELRDIYEQNNRKSDAVVSAFNDLTQAGWSLFEPSLSPAEFFARSWIIDVHDAVDTAQRLVVFLVLDALYAHFKSLPDSPLDADGHRSLRLLLVVDEARRVLAYGQQSLIGIVRESRSKGVSAFLISQSPDDFDIKADNFLENIGLGICFRSGAASSGVLKGLLGQAVDLGSLPTGVAVARLPDQSGVTRVRAWE